MTSPFINAGYTDKTVFRVLQTYGDLKEGELVVLSTDDATISPLFKNCNDGRYYMYLPGTDDLVSQDLELVALDGIKEGILDADGNLLFSTYYEWVESKDEVKENPKLLRTPQDYRELSPDTMIKIVVDGHEGEVRLFDLMLATHAVGSVCMNPRPNQTWDFLVSLFEEEGFNPICDDLDSKGSIEFNNAEQFKDWYFIGNRCKEIQAKLAEKQKERESLDNEIQALQSELENIK